MQSRAIYDMAQDKRLLPTQAKQDIPFLTVNLLLYLNFYITHKWQIHSSRRLQSPVSNKWNYFQTERSEKKLGNYE